MSNQVTLNASFGAKLDYLDELVKDKAKEVIADVAQSAVNMSPVDTGAYVTSFSIVDAGKGGGRSRTSNNKPTGQPPELMRQTAMGQLLSDISKLDFDNSLKFILRNRSPHSRAVEDGGPNWRRSGYGVFRRIRNLFS